MATCPGCGAENPPATAFCGECGAPQPHTAREATPFGKKTLLGLPVEFTHPPAEPVNPDPPRFNQTITGMPSPTLTPKTPEPPAENPGSPQELNHKRTLLGIALPGIAPTGQALASPPPTPESPAPELHTPPAAEATPVPAPPRRSPARRPRSPRRKLSWAWLSLGLLAAAAAGGLVALLEKRVPSLGLQSFEVTTDARDRLTLRCENCPPGSRLRHHGISASLQGELFHLELPSPLPVGANQLEFELLSSENQLERTLTLTVPVAFRVTTDLSERDRDPPRARVRVTTSPDAEVHVQGALVPVERGEAVFTLDWQKETRGESQELVPLSATLPIRITQGSSQKSTVAKIQTSILPLTVLTPAPGHILKGRPLALSGYTLPGAAVSSQGQTTRADAQGEFTIQLSRPQAGPLRVRASNDTLVSRTVEIQLSSPSLEPAAPRLTTPFQVNELRSVPGRVLLSRTSSGKTTTLLEVHEGCTAPPCVLRVVYGEPVELAVGQKVEAQGQIVQLDPLTLRATELR